MTTSTIQSLIDVLDTSFKHMQTQVSSTELENLAITIHRAMSVEGRHYHTPEHVLHLSDSTKPIQSLAALFHDIVYYQVDRGFSSEVCELICGYISEENNQIALTHHADPDDRIFQIVLDVFGLSAGETVQPVEGLNEFLSALVAAKEMGHILPEKELLKIIAYIEGTIPFRGTDEHGDEPFQILARRLQKVREDFQIPFTDAEIDETLQGAVVFANKDVDSFAEEDPGIFLDGTWKLLPETNITLRFGGIYTIRDYRKALQKTAWFLNWLDPNFVFHSYKGVPSEEEYRRMVTTARNNIDIAREYLGIKLLAMAILEGLAEGTGGDAPLSLFMGDVEREPDGKRGLEDFLPPVDTSQTGFSSPLVFKLLESGRTSETEFDLRNSPLSLFLYESLGPDRIKELLIIARRMFEGIIPPQQFLDSVDQPVVTTIARACASMVPTRMEHLLQLAQRSEVVIKTIQSNSGGQR